MKSTTVYTSTLPQDLLIKLDFYAKKFKTPKNQIIEKALEDYIDKIKEAEYIHSFKKAGTDPEMISMAEQGLEEYLKVLDDEAR